jgi:hypothetical protein
MASNPLGPPRGGPQHGGEPHATPRRQAPAQLGEDRSERCGPMAVERRVKEDGRALLLYAREPVERA